MSITTISGGRVNRNPHRVTTIKPPSPSKTTEGSVQHRLHCACSARNEALVVTCCPAVVQCCVVQSLHTICSKRFTLLAVMSDYALSRAVEKKKLKKMCGGKNFFLGGRKKYSLSIFGLRVGLRELKECIFL